MVRYQTALHSDRCCHNGHKRGQRDERGKGAGLTFRDEWRYRREARGLQAQGSTAAILIVTDLVAPTAGLPPAAVLHPLEGWPPRTASSLMSTWIRQLDMKSYKSMAPNGMRLVSRSPSQETCAKHRKNFLRFAVRRKFLPNAGRSRLEPRG